MKFKKKLSFSKPKSKPAEQPKQETQVLTESVEPAAQPVKQAAPQQAAPPPQTQRMEPEKSSGSKPWWMSGSEATEEALVEQERNKRQPLRFWLRADETKEIVFLDDAGFAFYEHNLKINGRWGNHYTCIRGIDARGCPLCNHFGSTGAGKRYLVTLRSVIDLTPFDTRDGEHREWSRKVLAAKTRTNKTLERKRKTRGSLIGAKYSVTRTDAKVENCGDDFEFVEEIDLGRFRYMDKHEKVEKPIEPVDYAEVYKPLDYTVLRSLIQDTETDVAEDQAGDMDSDVPF